MNLLDERVRDCKLISIDPGTTNLGLSIFTINPYTYEIIDIEPYSLVLAKLDSKNPEMSNVHEDRYVRLNNLRSFFKDLLEEINPAYVCCEAAFFSIRTVTAYGPLIETIQTLRMVLMEYDVGLPLVTFSPTEAKAAVGVKRDKVKKAAKLKGINKMAQKDAVLVAVKAIPEITKHLSRDRLDGLTDHAVDSIAIGFTGILKLRSNLEWKSSLRLPHYPLLSKEP